MMLAFYIIAPIVIYLMMIGYTNPIFYRSYESMRNNDRKVAARFSAVFWLVMLPIIAGHMVGNKDGSKSRSEVKIEARQAKEITEAKHQVALAKLRAEEDRVLTSQLQSIN